jgi:hypothetical protein
VEKEGDPVGTDLHKDVLEQNVEVKTATTREGPWE